MTQNVARRVSEHNSRHVFSTKGFTPWKLIFVEECGDDRSQTRAREKYWKSGTGKEQLKQNYIPR